MKDTVSWASRAQGRVKIDILIKDLQILFYILEINSLRDVEFFLRQIIHQLKNMSVLLDTLFVYSFKR